MYLIVVITTVSLLGSFLCSLMEAALYSIPRSRIESLKRQGNKGARRLSRLRSKIDEPIAAILTFNTAANTAGAAWAGALVATHYGDNLLGIFSGCFTAAVLFFSEIIPKSLGVTFANKLAPRLAIVIQILIWIFWPFVKLSVALTRLWGKNSHLNYPTEEDIISLAKLSHEGGTILTQEVKWINNALRLNDLRIRDIMTPASVVFSVPETLSLHETPMDSDHWRFSRVPVHKKNQPGKIVGVVRRKEAYAAIARNETGKKIRDVMSGVTFVEASMPMHKLLNLFIQSRTHLFCVKSPKNRFLGVVSLEDVLESLIGEEIVDEFDLHVDMQKLAKTKLTSAALRANSQSKSRE